MSVLLSEHQEILQLLLQNKVRFLVIGGYAVIHYGYKRTTGDMDLWIGDDDENKKALLTAFNIVGFKEEDISALANLDFTEPVVFSLGEEPAKMQFLTRINQVTFEEAWDKRTLTEIDGMSIPFIQYHHLILSKFNTGRAKDVADIEELQRIHKYKKEE